MNRVVINREALGHNLAVIDGWMRARGARWSVVTKSLCGFDDAVQALYDMGVRSIADSRLANLEGAVRVAPEAERWFLRLPDLSSADAVVRLSQISLNSESSVIRALSEAAVAQQRLHRVVIMVELGDPEEAPAPGERGFRAVVTVGQLDTDVTGLTPIAAGQQIAGASSDMLVLNLGDSPAGLEVGDSVAFRVSYSAFVRLMGSAYVERLVEAGQTDAGAVPPKKPVGVVAAPLFGGAAPGRCAPLVAAFGMNGTGRL